MGIVNNAVYASWFEMGRTELFCEINLPYGKMEKIGLMLPVAELNVKYHSPAYYEDLLTINTSITEMPASRIVINYEIDNAEGKRIASGFTVHAFLDAKSRRPTRVPEFLKLELARFIFD
jgi:acyl-CoA thioester hydrolase